MRSKGTIRTRENAMNTRTVKNDLNRSACVARSVPMEPAKSSNLPTEQTKGDLVELLKASRTFVARAALVLSAILCAPLVRADPTPALLYKWGSLGAGDGQFNTPVNV